MLTRLAARVVWIVLVSSAAFCAGAGEGEAPKLSVSAIGLRVVRANPLKEKVVWPAGTTVSLIVSSTTGDLLHFDAVDSTITKFVDDKGTDLQARPKDVTAEQIALKGFGHAPIVDKDVKTCAIEVNAPSLPVKGASQIQLQGTIAMYCATQKKETFLPNLPIKNGTKIAGPNKLELEIVEMNEAQRDLGRDAMCFVLRSERELDDVAEIKFYRPDGSEVKATRTSTSTLSIQGAVKVDWSYTLAERVDVGNVKLYTWSDIEKRRVKFDVTIDLGL